MDSSNTSGTRARLPIVSCTYARSEISVPNVASCAVAPTHFSLGEPGWRCAIASPVLVEHEMRSTSHRFSAAGQTFPGRGGRQVRRISK